MHANMAKRKQGSLRMHLRWQSVHQHEAHSGSAAFAVLECAAAEVCINARSDHPFTRATIRSYINHSQPYNDEAIQMSWAQEYAQLGQELDWVDGLSRVIAVVSGETTA